MANDDYEEGYQDALNYVWESVLECYSNGNGIGGKGDIWEILLDLGIKRREV